MTAGLSWINHLLTTANWTASATGNAYQSSDPANVLNAHPKKNFLVDLSAIVTTSGGEKVWEATYVTSEVTAQVFAICGITFDDPTERENIEFSIVCRDTSGGTVLVNTQSGAGSVDNSGWQTVDKDRGTLVWTVASEVASIAEIQVIQRTSTGSYSGAWTGIGHVWLGQGLRFGSSAPKVRSGRPWTHTNRDVRIQTPNTRFSRKRGSFKRMGFSVGSMGSDFTELNGDGETLAACLEYAGAARSVVATHSSGVAGASIYGDIVESQPLTEEIDDASWRGSFTIEERG